MKKIITITIVLIISIMLSFTIVGCNDAGSDENLITGEFKFEAATREVDDLERPVKEDNGDNKIDEYERPVYEKKEVKFYRVIGYTISKEDQEKINNNDFSSFTSEQRTLTIPTTHKEKGDDEEVPVEEIGVSAFANQSLFKEIVVGDNIKKIGQSAFEGCNNLEKITLPFLGEEETSTKDKKLFVHIFGSENITGTTEVKVKSQALNNTSSESIISGEEKSYYVPSNLTEVVLTKGNEIRECAFYGVKTLTTVEFPTTLVKISRYAFYGCTNLSVLKLPDTLKVIDQNAFNGCTNLLSLGLSENSTLEKIYSSAFEGCTSLCSTPGNVGESKLMLPSSIKELGGNAFKGCTSIEFVDFSNIAIERLPSSLFANCTSIQKGKWTLNSATKTDNLDEVFVGCYES